MLKVAPSRLELTRPAIPRPAPLFRVSVATRRPRANRLRRHLNVAMLSANSAPWSMQVSLAFDVDQCYTDEADLAGIAQAVRLPLTEVKSG